MGSRDGEESDRDNKDGEAKKVAKHDLIAFLRTLVLCRFQVSPQRAAETRFICRPNRKMK
jgi:hypothetical protein